LVNFQHRRCDSGSRNDICLVRKRIGVKAKDHPPARRRTCGLSTNEVTGEWEGDGICISRGRRTNPTSPPKFLTVLDQVLRWQESYYLYYRWRAESGADPEATAFNGQQFSRSPTRLWRVFDPWGILVPVFTFPKATRETSAPTDKRVFRCGRGKRRRPEYSGWGAGSWPRRGGVSRIGNPGRRGEGMTVDDRIVFSNRTRPPTARAA